MTPEQRDFVVEPVPEASPDKQVRVRRFQSILDLDQFFPTEAEAISYAVTIAGLHRRRAFLQTVDGWLVLRAEGAATR